MININLTLRNPWSNRFNNMWNKSGLFTKHKAWEVEFLKTTSILHFDFGLTFCQSHSGVSLGLGLLGYEICVQMYDTRHWNDEKNDWEVYD